MFMAHGRNFVAAKTSERSDYVVMFLAHERRNIAQSQFTFHSPSEWGGWKGGGGSEGPWGGAEKVQKV
jgi:hypothetical protein